MSNLYELTQEFLPVKNALDAMLQDGEIDSESYLDTLDAAKFDLDIKVENVAKYIIDIESLSTGMALAIKRMQERKKSVDNRAASLRNYLHHQMDIADIKKFERPDITVSFRKSSSLTIDDESKLEAYKREKVTFSYDKKAITDAIKSGVEVDGAHIQTNQNLTIK